MDPKVRTSSSSLLFTEDQLEIEKLAQRLIASPEMKLRRAEVERRYRTDAAAVTAAGAETLQGAIEELMVVSSLAAANDDPANPKIVWSITEPIRWNRFDKPGSRWAVNNPDNIYRGFAVNAKYRYEVTAHPRGIAPAQYSFMLWDTFFGEDTEMNQFLDSPLDGLQDVAIKTEVDGSFKFTIDSDPANGRANHIQCNDAARSVFVRDTLTDRATQSPLDLRVRRIDDQPKQPRDFRQICERAAHFLDAVTATELFFKNKGLPNAHPNQLSKPWLRGGDWGFNVNGQIKLAADDALVINIDRVGAKYFGIVVSDPWLCSRAHIGRPGSLNNTAAEAEPDGHYTFVVSAQDPGILNWVDTDGLLEGFLVLRWQGLPSTLNTADGGVRSTRLVKVADVPGMLQQATRVTP